MYKRIHNLSMGIIGQRKRRKRSTHAKNTLKMVKVIEVTAEEQKQINFDQNAHFLVHQGRV